MRSYFWPSPSMRLHFCSLHLSSGQPRAWQAAQPEIPVISFFFCWFFLFLIARANTGVAVWAWALEWALEWPAVILRQKGLDLARKWVVVYLLGAGFGGRIFGSRPSGVEMPSGPCMRLEPDRPCKPWLAPAAVVGCCSRLVKSFFHHSRLASRSPPLPSPRSQPSPWNVGQTASFGALLVPLLASLASLWTVTRWAD